MKNTSYRGDPYQWGIDVLVEHHELISSFYHYQEYASLVLDQHLPADVYENYYQPLRLLSMTTYIHYRTISWSKGLPIETFTRWTFHSSLHFRHLRKLPQAHYHNVIWLILYLYCKTISNTALGYHFIFCKHVLPSFSKQEHKVASISRWLGIRSALYYLANNFENLARQLGFLRIYFYGHKSVEQFVSPRLSLHTCALYGKIVMPSVSTWDCTTPYYIRPRPCYTMHCNPALPTMKPEIFVL